MSTKNIKEMQAVKNRKFAKEISDIKKWVQEAKTFNDVFKVKNRLKQIVGEYGDEYSQFHVSELMQELQNKVNSLLEGISKQYEALEKQEMDIITENTKNYDSKEELEELETKANQKLLEIIMQLGKNKILNEQAIRSEMKQAVVTKSRVNAIALSKLIGHAEYGDLITAQYKKELAVLVKSPTNKAMEKENKPKLKKIHEQKVALFHERMKMTRIKESFENKDSYYFRDKEITTKEKLHKRIVRNIAEA